MRLSIGHRVSLDVKTAREGSSLYLHLDVNTPWGVIPITGAIHEKTLRSMLIWFRSNYATMAYDFVVSRTPLNPGFPKE
jgi:hypothetical protein